MNRKAKDFIRFQLAMFVIVFIIALGLSFSLSAIFDVPDVKYVAIAFGSATGYVIGMSLIELFSE